MLCMVDCSGHDLADSATNDRIWPTATNKQARQIQIHIKFLHSISNSDYVNIKIKILHNAPLFQNGANLDSRRVLAPAPLLESRIKKFTPHCVCRPSACRRALPRVTACTLGVWSRAGHHQYHHHQHQHHPGHPLPNQPSSTSGLRRKQARGRLRGRGLVPGGSPLLLFTHRRACASTQLPKPARVRMVYRQCCRSVCQVRHPRPL